MGNAALWNRLSSLGLRGSAESLKEEIRLRLRREGLSKLESNDRSVTEMWSVYRPVVEGLEESRRKSARRLEEVETSAREKVEALQRAREEQVDRDEEPQLEGFPSDVDEVLDPEYLERDPANQLRDGLLWAAMEFQRVIRDGPDGAVLELGESRPPNAFALFVVRTYALSPLEKRRDLIARALSFASKCVPSVDGDGEVSEEEEDGFLDAIS